MPVADALAHVLARATPLALEQVPLAAAAGRVLGADVVSPVDLPPFASSSMDGYAVRAADVPGALRVVGHVAAGRPESRAVAAGEAIEISTGGVVPDGADAVVPVELVHASAGQVEIPARIEAGANIRGRGGDIGAGETVLGVGELLTPARLAALAACGTAAVSAFRRPRVSIVVTGTELRAPGEELGPGEIYESNGVMLAAALERIGAVVERTAATEDSEAAHAAALEAALQADVVVTSGGVSVGPHDLVRRVQERLGVEEVFWGVAMRPGKPLAFGVRGQTLVFGLPGNPVSSLVGCLLFVQPAILALQGHPHPEPAFRPGVLATAVRRRPERDDFVRASVVWTDTGVELSPILGQESHMIGRTSVADALVRIPRGEGMLEAGSAASFVPIDGWPKR
jgi:molybdopterin molybdotransferase